MKITSDYQIVGLYNLYSISVYRGFPDYTGVGLWRCIIIRKESQIYKKKSPVPRLTPSEAVSIQFLAMDPPMTLTEARG